MNRIEELKQAIATRPYSKMELDVIKEMFDWGLDPYSPVDVKAYWKARGIDLEEIRRSNPPFDYWSYDK